MKHLLWMAVLVGLSASVCLAEIEISEPPRNTGTRTSAIAVPAPDSPVAVAITADGDVLKFRNGDGLHGVLVSAAPAGLRWRRTDVKEPITFALDAVGDVTLAPRVKASQGARAIVELTNGDQVAGELTGLDEKALTLKTWFAGTLAIKRNALQRLSFVSEISEAAYSGPTSLDEWKNDGNRNAWSFKKGALFGLGSGTIGRDVKLPDVASIEMDIAWRGQLYGTVGFGFDDYKQIYNSGGYALMFSGTSVYLQRYRARSGNNNVGSNIDVPELQRKAKMHVAIRVSKTNRLVVLYIDGKLVKQWNESEEWASKGTGLVFISQGQGQLKITNIAVTTWDGRLDEEAAATAKESDLVRLSNGDKVSGMVKKIAGGQVALATSFAEMNVPVERIAKIEFAAAKAERARRQADDVWAFFPDGGRLTLALEKLDEQNLVGATENCGRVTASLGAFRRVQFHIYDKSDDSGDDDDDSEWATSTGGRSGRVRSQMIIMD